MSAHAGHSHPNTPAARAKCRRQNSRERVIRPTPIILDPDMSGRVLEFSPAVGIPTFTRATADHCELCGTFDIESLTTGDQGYTACCNEPTCHGDIIAVWAWRDASNGSTGTIEACCSARVTLPHDMIVITHRV